MNRWLSRADVPKGETYDERWRKLEATGADIHGEADCVQRLLERFGPRPDRSSAAGRRPWRVLDAGCGTGRVGIELARRGCDVVGVDLDPVMLDQARRKHPDGRWVLCDLVALDLSDGEPFDAIAAPGNVMIFLTPGTEGAVLRRFAEHLRPGGVLVTGFQLGGHRLALAAYDRLAEEAGLEPVERWATWDGAPFEGGDYAVSVHRLPPGR